MNQTQQLKTFLEQRRTYDAPFSLVGMGNDSGKYNIADADYDTFLHLAYNYIYGNPPRALSLIERHKDHTHILVDLDFRYEDTKGGPLMRYFNHDQIYDFVVMYMAAMIYFTRTEDLEEDLIFYDMVKPGPEVDKSQHKDGVHIQCPTINTTPKYQNIIRGFLLANNTIGKIFGGTGMSNSPDDCYDKSVINSNGWFLYGCCKPDKAQYKVEHIWKLSIADINDFLNGADPDNYEELIDLVKEYINEIDIPTNPFEIMKTLSIRRGNNEIIEPSVRDIRKVEWEEIYNQWLSNRKTIRKVTNAVVRQTQRVEGDERTEQTNEHIQNTEAVNEATSISDDDIRFAYRLCKECINPERRAGEYTDWVTLAFCLKNIANTDESYEAWVDVTRRVEDHHKKKNYTEEQLRARWNLIRIGGARRPIKIGSLIEWAKEDNPDKLKAIRSETLTLWIINYLYDTDVDLADLVYRMYKHEFRSSAGTKRSGLDLYYYNTEGNSWKKLKHPIELRKRLSDEVQREIMSAQNHLLKKAIDATDQNTRDSLNDRSNALAKIVKKLKSSNSKDSVLKESQEKFYDEDFATRLDCNPDIIGVSNGVLVLNHADKEDMSDIRVMFRKGRPDDNISFQMGRMEPDMESIAYVPYDPNDPDQIALMEFFKLIYPEDDLREYVITLLASCLEGRNKEQKFWINTGGGSNGKSMIQTLMEYVFGDYQTSLQTTVLTRKRPESGAANPDMITTKCKRYIYMGEPDAGEKLNTSRMKQLSGEDRIEARGLFSDQEKFNMMGKIFLNCNDLPPIGSMDNGTWRRIRVIPHISTFKDPGSPDIDPTKNIHPKDFNMKQKLEKWRVACLGLFVHYYNTRYLKGGLKEPECVLAASNKYKEANDVFMTFFNETYVRLEGAPVISSKMVKLDFREWKKKVGRDIDLKEAAVLERMKMVCGNGSTEKEFRGITHASDVDDNEVNDMVDISGAAVRRQG